MRRPAKPVGIVHAATNLGLHPGGVEHLGRALLNAGLPELLSAVEIATVSGPTYVLKRDPATHVFNAEAIADYARRLAAVVGEVVEAGYFPLVLGGDCSILLGNLLAFDRRLGLLFIDGHTDCYEPAASTGELAELELGIAMGVTSIPGPLAKLGNGRALVQPSDGVLVGPRDGEEPGWRPAPPDALTIDLAELTWLGIDRAIGRALERLCRDELDGFWVHLDVDVLDDRIMAAVDYRSPGGLSWGELVSLLRDAIHSGRALGVEVTIFNPLIDPDHAVRRALVAELTRALRPRRQVDAGAAPTAVTTPMAPADELWSQSTDELRTGCAPGTFSSLRSSTSCRGEWSAAHTIARRVREVVSGKGAGGEEA